VEGRCFFVFVRFAVECLAPMQGLPKHLQGLPANFAARPRIRSTFRRSVRGNGAQVAMPRVSRREQLPDPPGPARITGKEKKRLSEGRESRAVMPSNSWPK